MERGSSCGERIELWREGRVVGKDKDTANLYRFLHPSAHLPLPHVVPLSSPQQAAQSPSTLR